MSVPASDRLGSTRVRRLLDVELEENATLAEGVTGPLGDHVVTVWIDVPEPGRTVVEVRAADRPVSRRALRIGEVDSDAAARFVAITTAEMIAIATRPRPVRKPSGPRKPTPQELEVASRSAPAVSAVGSTGIVFLPTVDAVLAGPSIGAAFRVFGAGARLFGRGLGSGEDTGLVRWLELGLALDYRIWLAPAYRAVVGADAAMATLRIDDESGESEEAWTPRVAALLGFEAQLAGPAWLGISVEPGVVARPRGDVEGAWIGVDLSLTLEKK